MIRFPNSGGFQRLARDFPRELSRELRPALNRIGQDYRRAMFERFKARTSGPPFYRNIGEGLKTRSGAARGTVGYQVELQANEPNGGRLIMFVGDRATAHYIRIQNYGGTVRATRSKYLTIPLPDNLTAAGVPRFPSARALFEQYPGRVRVVKAKSGDLVIIFRPPSQQGPVQPGKRSLGPIYGKNVLYLWKLKESVTLRPRLGFEWVQTLMRPLRERELRGALFRVVKKLRAQSTSRAAGKGAAF